MDPAVEELLQQFDQEKEPNASSSQETSQDIEDKQVDPAVKELLQQFDQEKEMLEASSSQETNSDIEDRQKEPSPKEEKQQRQGTDASESKPVTVPPHPKETKTRRILVYSFFVTLIISVGGYVIYKTKPPSNTVRPSGENTSLPDDRGWNPSDRSKRPGAPEGTTGPDRSLFRPELPPFREKEYLPEEQDIEWEARCLLRTSDVVAVFYPKDAAQQIKDRIKAIEENRELTDEQPFLFSDKKREILKEMIGTIKGQQIESMIKEIKDFRKAIGKPLAGDQEIKKKQQIVDEMINTTILRQEALRRFPPSDLEVSERFRQFSQMLGSEVAFNRWVKGYYGSPDNFRRLLQRKIAEERYLHSLEANHKDKEEEIRRLRSDFVIKQRDGLASLY